jgi:hypothetical protein
LSTLLDETSSLRKIVGSLPETLLKTPLFETLPNYRVERAFPRLFVGVAHFFQPRARVNGSITTFKGTHDSHVVINCFQ